MQLLVFFVFTLAFSDPTPEILVQGQVEAYNNRDITKFLSFYSDNIEVYSYPDTLRYKGKAEMRRIYEPMFKNNPALRCVIEKRITHGSFVIDHELVTWNADGGQLYAVAIYEVEKGLIQKVWFLPNPHKN